jgi:hypothetical protein
MKKTAVEWLENQIMTSKYFYKVLEDMNSRGTVAQPNIFRQAKTMEKEQTIDFVDNLIVGMSREKIEQYYNENYKKD